MQTFPDAVSAAYFRHLTPNREVRSASFDACHIEDIPERRPLKFSPDRIQVLEFSKWEIFRHA
jgi:hypothetical protein